MPPPQCPTCKKPTRIYGGMGFSTQIGVESYWEGDERHVHDKNYFTGEYSCRECKTKFSITEMQGCPVRGCQIHKGMSKIGHVTPYVAPPPPPVVTKISETEMLYTYADGRTETRHIPPPQEAGFINICNPAMTINRIFTMNSQGLITESSPDSDSDDSSQNSRRGCEQGEKSLPTLQTDGFFAFRSLVTNICNEQKSDLPSNARLVALFDKLKSDLKSI